MRRELAEMITEQCGELYEEYSGRGMFGNRTTGVSLSQYDPSWSELVATTAFALGEMSADEYDTAYELFEDLKRVRTDSLGLGTIVY